VKVLLGGTGERNPCSGALRRPPELFFVVVKKNHKIRDRLRLLACLFKNK
jgi:hypothetical protein